MRLRTSPYRRAKPARPRSVGTRVLTFDAASSAQVASGGSLTWSHTVGTRTNRALVVGVSLLNPLAQTVTTVTYGGVGLAFHSAQANGTGGRVEWWYLEAPASGAANIVVTVNVATGITGGATSWAGADQTDPLDTATGATGTGTAISVTQASAPDRYVIDVVASAATSLTVTAGQTERWNQAFTGLTGAGSTKPGATSTAMGWTAALSAVWVALATSVLPFTPAPTVTAVAQANLGGLSATIAATPTVGAIATANLGGLTATVTAGVTEPATLQASLGPLTATITATPKVNATAQASLGGLTATIAAKVTVPAVALASLGGLTAHATATVTTPATLTANLGGLTATAVAIGPARATIVSSTADGYIQSTDPVYATARSGSNLVADHASSFIAIGQVLGHGNYYCQEGFLVFDLTNIPTTITVTNPRLSLTGLTDGSTTDFTIEARTGTVFNGPLSTLSTADYIPGANLAAATLLATFDTALFDPAGPNVFTESGTNLADAIAAAAGTVLYISLSSSRHRTNNAPAGDENVLVASSDTTGTGSDPRLAFDYTAVQPATLTAALGGLTASIVAVPVPVERNIPEPTHTEGPDGTSTVTGPNGSSTVVGDSAATQATGLVGSTSAQG